LPIPSLNSNKNICETIIPRIAINITISLGYSAFLSSKICDIKACDYNNVITRPVLEAAIYEIPANSPLPSGPSTLAVIAPVTKPKIKVEIEAANELRY
jgi:hypothetical protein